MTYEVLCNLCLNEVKKSEYIGESHISWWDFPMYALFLPSFRHKLHRTSYVTLHFLQDPGFVRQAAQPSLPQDSLFQGFLLHRMCSRVCPPLSTILTLPNFWLAMKQSSAFCTCFFSSEFGVCGRNKTDSNFALLPGSSVSWFLGFLFLLLNCGKLSSCCFGGFLNQLDFYF